MNVFGYKYTAFTDTNCKRLQFYLLKNKSPVKLITEDYFNTIMDYKRT